jgi:hypothetical protein
MPLIQKENSISENQYVFTHLSDSDNSDTEDDSRYLVKRLNVNFKEVIAFIDKSEGKTSPISESSTTAPTKQSVHTFLLLFFLSNLTLNYSQAKTNLIQLQI